MAAKTTKADAAATAKALAAADDKKVETKAAPAKKAEEKKPAAEKKAAPAKKAAAKPAEKKTTTKKEVVKAAFIQDNYGNSKTFDDITKAAMDDFKANNKKVAITKVDVYIKAIENKVYYVINDSVQGDIDLF